MKNVNNVSLYVPVLIALLLSAVPSIAVEYEVIDLTGTLGGFTTYAYGINELGQVVGWTMSHPGPASTFLWSAEEGFQDIPGSLGSFGRGINDLGQVVGYATYNFYDYRSFVWSPEVGFQYFGTLGGIVQATGINNFGQVVGWCSIPPSWDARAFIWTGEAGMQFLGIQPDGYGAGAEAINDLGQVVGYIDTDNWRQRAVLWHPGGSMDNLGVLSEWSDDENNVESYAHGINNFGHVVGHCWRFTDDTMHAFLWSSEGGMQDIGTLPGGTRSYANGINDRGQVVGVADTSTGEYRGFVWTAEAGMQELATLPGAGFYGATATAINNLGQIIGYSETSPDWRHACMWQPVTPEAILAELDSYIQEHVLLENIEPELETSLLAKVDAATAALDRGNLNTAENQLNALINQVEAQKGNKITVEAAEEIIRLAEEIIEALSGQ